MTAAQSLPQAAVEYDRAQRAIVTAAIGRIRRQWRAMGSDFDAAWLSIADVIVAIVESTQSRLASNADAYVLGVMEEMGAPVSTSTVPVHAGLVGLTGDGLAVDASLSNVTIRAKQGVARGLSSRTALDVSGKWLTAATATIFADTSRSAESSRMFTAGASGYIRMLTPPSCGRCAILAGRYYRWNSGFQRHPGCDCRHVPASSSEAPGMTVNATKYFNSLSPEAQVRMMGSAANAEAVRLGADPAQIINAYTPTAGMRAAGIRPTSTIGTTRITTIGTTRRASAFQQQVALRRYGSPTAYRVMPQTILATSASRAEAERLLRMYGWIRDESAADTGRSIIAAQMRAERIIRARERRAGIPRN